MDPSLHGTKRSEIPMTTDGYKSEVKILVVDDDPSIGQLMADFLHNEGYQPVIYSQPQEALRFSIKNKFGLAFIDINMPGMSGLELASRLKEQDPLCEVVFVTGYGSFDNAVQALKIGAYDYLRKPFGVNELNLCLKRFQERQALKEQVQVAEQRYFHLVQNIPSLVFVIYKDLSLEFINRACEAMLGYTPEEAMGDPKWFQERVHSSDFERIRRLLFSAFQSHNSRFSAECRLIHRDGHLIHAMVGSI
ncbi:MAG: response regulator, partial [Deltaproteobacteria bacterium]|nr:response regulator [Deltaproteobacteria bacterium]